jgi:Fe2+ transport system protein B
MATNELINSIYNAERGQQLFNYRLPANQDIQDPNQILTTNERIIESTEVVNINNETNNTNINIETVVENSKDCILKLEEDQMKNKTVTIRKLDRSKTTRRQGLTRLETEKDSNKRQSIKISDNYKPITLKRFKTDLFKIEDTLVENQKTRKQRIKLKIRNYILSNIHSTVVIVTTVFCLFAPDFKVLFLNPQYDDILNISFLVCLLSYFFHFFLKMWVMKDYINTFTFYSDFIVAASMFLEIDWFLIPIVSKLVE